MTPYRFTGKRLGSIEFEVSGSKLLAPVVMSCMDVHSWITGGQFFQPKLLLPLMHRKLSPIHGQWVQSDRTTVKMCPCPCRTSVAVFLQNQPLQHSIVKHMIWRRVTVNSLSCIAEYFPSDRNDYWLTCATTCQRLQSCGKSRGVEIFSAVTGKTTRPCLNANVCCNHSLISWF